MLLLRIKYKINNILTKRNIHTSIPDTSGIEKYVYISSDSRIGQFVFINEYTRITKSIIGNFVSIGSNVSIGQGEHSLERLSTNAMFYSNPYSELTQKDCIIGHDVWLGSYCSILRGVRVGNGAVIGANAVVTRDVPDFAIVVGIPGRILRYRFNDKIRAFLTELEWWNWSPEEFKKHDNIFKLNIQDMSLDRFQELLEKNRQ